MKLLVVFCFMFFATTALAQDSPVDTIQWNSNLNTGSNATYLTIFEKEVLRELNKVRNDPAGYARQYISPQLQVFKGKLNTKSRVQTNEGISAVKECINVLGRTKSMGVLNPDAGLAATAKQQTTAQSKTSEVGHTSPNGDSFQDRVRKLKFPVTAECISYGEPTPRDVVIALLIDDGVSNRGHRKIILDARLSKVGIAAGSHVQYRNMCTLDFAGVLTPARH